MKYFFNLVILIEQKWIEEKHEGFFQVLAQGGQHILRRATPPGTAGYVPDIRQSD